MTVGQMVAGVVVLTIALVAYYPIRKWVAGRSLGSLTAELRPCPVLAEEVRFEKGSFRARAAYLARLPGGREVTLELGGWDRGTVAINKVATRVVQRVAGVLVVSPPSGGWLAHLRSPELLLTKEVAGGTLVVWSDLPSGESVRRHLRELDAALGGTRE